VEGNPPLYMTAFAVSDQIDGAAREGQPPPLTALRGVRQVDELHFYGRQPPPLTALRGIRQEDATLFA